MAKPSSIVMKADPEFKKWIEARQQNLQKLVAPGKMTLIDTQRLIAKTPGVEITREMVKQMERMRR